MKFRVEEPWYVGLFLAGPALGLDLLLRPTAVPSVRWVDFIGLILCRLWIVKKRSQAGFCARMTSESSKG